MRTALLLIAFACAAAAQVTVETAVAPTPAASTVPAPKAAEKPRLGPQEFAVIESSFNNKIQTLDSAVPFDLLGGARGVYVDGYGVVFTAEVSLIVNPPMFTPFGGEIKPAQIQEVRKKKLAHLSVLRQAMREMMQSAGGTLTALPAGQKIMLAVRLLYQPYETTTGLPAQIVMTADRNSARSGSVQMEEQ
jgi:hypothetical protein